MDSSANFIVKVLGEHISINAERHELLADVAARAAEVFLCSELEIENEVAQELVSERKFYITNLKTENGEYTSLTNGVMTNGLHSGMTLEAQLNSGHHKFLESQEANREESQGTTSSHLTTPVLQKASHEPLYKTPANWEIPQQQDADAQQSAHSGMSSSVPGIDVNRIHNNSPAPSPTIANCNINSLNEVLKFTATEILTATNNFEDARKLGSGGFGTVYRGVLDGTTVAVKRIFKNVDVDGFVSEIKILHRIRHPHIIQVIGICLELTCIVTEYLHGGSLDDRLKRPLDAKYKALTWSDMLQIMADTSAALLYLHKHKNILHRDIKPANILLGDQNSVKLADMGYARSLDQAVKEFSMTGGTPGHMDPYAIKQIKSGESTVSCAMESDIYSFGVALLQVMVGQRNVSQLHSFLEDDACKTDSLRDIEKAANFLLDKLDPTAGDWNVELARKALLVGLKCMDADPTQRPKLETNIQPLLYDIAMEASRLNHENAAVPPSLTPPAPRNATWLALMTRESLSGNGRAEIPLLQFRVFLHNNIGREVHSVALVSIVFVYVQEDEKMPKSVVSSMELHISKTQEWWAFMESSPSFKAQRPLLQELRVNYFTEHSNSPEMGVQKVAKKVEATRAYIWHKKIKSSKQLLKVSKQWRDVLPPSCDLVLHDSGVQFFPPVLREHDLTSASSSPSSSTSSRKLTSKPSMSSQTSSVGPTTLASGSTERSSAQKVTKQASWHGKDESHYASIFSPTQQSKNGSPIGSPQCAHKARCIPSSSKNEDWEILNNPMSRLSASPSNQSESGGSSPTIRTR